MGLKVVLQKTREPRGGKTRPPTVRALKRQTEVEKFMVAGLTITKMASLKNDNGKPLIGSYETIAKDVDVIRSRWLEKDTEWFHRAKLARVEAVERLKAQLLRQSLLVADIKNNQYDTKDLPRTLTYAESQLTTTITRIYEIESDLDPEQYVDERIKRRINAKVAAAENSGN